MPLTFSTVVPEAFEKQGSPTEQWSDQGLQATVVLICPWADRYDLVDDLLGRARPYPHRTGMYASAASIAPLSTKVDQDGQGASYETAEVTVTYGTFETVDGGGDPEDPDILIYSEDLTPNGEFLTLDHKPFSWATVYGKKLTKEEAPGKLIMSVDFTQTQYNMTSLHSDLIDLINHTNNAAVTATMLGVTFPTDSLLYAGSTPTRSVTTAGIGKWTVAKKFCYRENGWNKFWRPGDPDDPSVEQGWYPIFKTGGTQYYSFPQADFSTILL